MTFQEAGEEHSLFAISARELAERAKIASSGSTDSALHDVANELSVLPKYSVSPFRLLRNAGEVLYLLASFLVDILEGVGELFGHHLHVRLYENPPVVTGDVTNLKLADA